jgi:hypothetical protein
MELQYPEQILKKLLLWGNCLIILRHINNISDG